mmetsp:Transcript_27359/g.81693  ORF Transcript_27359/g.81693 Transcript_27359/m.81693 type:complete len:243 (+) Transcript_27359:336-1064(+)
MSNSMQLSCAVRTRSCSSSLAATNAPCSRSRSARASANLSSAAARCAICAAICFDLRVALGSAFERVTRTSSSTQATRCSSTARCSAKAASSAVATASAGSAGARAAIARSVSLGGVTRAPLALPRSLISLRVPNERELPPACSVNSRASAPGQPTDRRSSLSRLWPPSAEMLFCSRHSVRNEQLSCSALTSATAPSSATAAWLRSSVRKLACTARATARALAPGSPIGLWGRCNARSESVE